MTTFDPNVLLNAEFTTTAPAEPDWSPYQCAIFDHVENTKHNLSIEAVAGSGKSTTIVAATKRLPANSKALFLAFNKSIVRDLEAKLPISTDAATLNSLGHGLLMRKLRNQGLSPKLDGYRLWNITRNVITPDDWEEYGTSLVRMLSLARASAVGILVPNDYTTFTAMLGDYDVDIPLKHEIRACRQAAVIFNKLLNIEDSFDFDDQLYMPVYWEVSFPRYDAVFVDEAQDLSPIQHLMLGRLADSGARIIAVGDSRQAIYGFRGADSQSMFIMAERFDMTLLPLSISYRCPKAVVRLAQDIVPHIEAAESAPEGTVIYLDEEPDVADFPPEAMILCRTNGPIFGLALQFLKEQKPCRVMSSYGKDIVKFVKNFKVNTTDELRDALKVWRDKEIAEAESRKFWGKINVIHDKYEALLPFCEVFKLKSQVILALQKLIDGNVGPILSTVHKAKGLEADDVYILRPDLLPAPFAKTEAALEQERNLKYVAVTRARKNLYFLPEEL